jgi:hypothetical protein
LPLGFGLVAFVGRGVFLDDDGQDVADGTLPRLSANIGREMSSRQSDCAEDLRRARRKVSRRLFLERAFLFS